MPPAVDAIPTLEPPPSLPEMPSLPSEPPPPPKRMRSLRVSTGAAPTAVDLGSEADMTSNVGRPDNYGAEDPADQVNKGWWYSFKGYVRAPMRLSVGPHDDKSPGNWEPHSPPRVPGQASGDWTYLAIASNPVVNLYATVGNSRVSANVLLGAATAIDSGFQDLDQIGGISQAYLTLKFPDAFGNRGGMALTAGSFSMRYGNAGPGERSSGYYGTYLFGRTHTVGADLTADVDLTDRWELTVEGAMGGMIEVVPYDPVQLKNGFLPTATNKEASTFVGHGHASLAYDDWFRLGVHYMRAWSPFDIAPPLLTGPNKTPTQQDIESRMTTYGADMHFDGLNFGSGYIGYSRVDVKNGSYIGPALQVVHGTSGTGFRGTYFGKKDAASNNTPTNDAGTVDTVLFQWIFKLSRVFGRAPLGRETTLGLFGMYNYIHSPINPAHVPPIGDSHEENIHEHRFKGGAEMEVQAHKFMNVGLRFDWVQPSLFDRDPTYWNNIIRGHATGSDAFQAISPRLIFHTNWKSKELVIVDYTHYFLGPRAYVGSPYSTVLKSDANMVSITALFSF